MTPENERPHHRGEGIRATTPILQPPAPVVNTSDWHPRYLAHHLELSLPELRARLGRFDTYRYGRLRLVRREVADALIREQLAEEVGNV